MGAGVTAVLSYPGPDFAKGFFWSDIFVFDRDFENHGSGVDDIIGVRNVGSFLGERVVSV